MMWRTQLDETTVTNETQQRQKILAICTVDIMAWKLLLPWFLGLLDAGFEVHIACAGSDWFENLAAYGFHMHDVPLRRRINPLVHIVPLWLLYRLMRRERFVLVNAHSPIAAAVGRLAGWLARVPLIIYTVHGFYFHDNMPRWKRRAFIALEWLLGRITDRFMFVSDEDRQTALREGIAANAAASATIYNGVDLEAYLPKSSGGAALDAARLRSQLRLPEGAPIVGIVGRVVKEKGYLEFAKMAKLVAASHNDVHFLVVGDALPSDRDGIVRELRKRVKAADLEERFRFTGFTDHVSDYLQLMNIFVLPSYREGFPRSVLEAMSCGLPVVATDIRGCREAVVDDETGLLVPPRNGAALARAVELLLRDPGLSARLGSAGRERAVRRYDQRLVQTRFVDFIQDALAPKSPAQAMTKPRQLQRFFDAIVAGIGAILLAPLMIAIAAVIRLNLGASPVFAQRRVGLDAGFFTIYKFRTMTDTRDEEGNLLPDEQRLTALGTFLRSTSLDELPQFWNVLRGDMSLVGPRPLLPEYLPRYTEFQRRRHEVRPGITGWVQVNGRNNLTWEQKFEMDVWYVDHCSVWLDLKILWQTVAKVFRRDGITQTGQATMPEFMGSAITERHE